jgi:hypothetical protein
MGILLLAASMLLLGTAVWLLVEMRRDTVREPLLFGLETPERAAAEDLGAGDYGLRGPAWFFHHVAGDSGEPWHCLTRARAGCRS